MPDNELQNKLRKEWQDYCVHKCPRRDDSEAGMPSCGPCGWEEDEDDDYCDREFRRKREDERR